MGYALISRIIYLSAYASYLHEVQFNPSSTSSVYHYQSSSALIQNPSSTSPVTQFTHCDSTSIYTMSRKYATIVPEPPTPTVRIQVSIQAIIIRRKEMGAPKEQPDDPGTLPSLSFFLSFPRASFYFLYWYSNFSQAMGNNLCLFRQNGFGPRDILRCVYLGVWR